MFYPSMLHLPSFAGFIVGAVFGSSVWADVNPILGVTIGLVVVGFGFWLSCLWSDKFSESFRKDLKESNGSG
jgi:hypothetical protein